MSVTDSEYSTRFIASLRKNLTADHFTSLQACLDCRQCGSACAWYLGTGDEKLHPKYKTDFIRSVYDNHIRIGGRIRRKLGLSKPLSVVELRDHMPYYWKCTTCGRCTLACPLGLSNRGLVRLARAAYTDSGLVMENPALKQVYEGSRDMRHSFALSKEQVHLRTGFISECEGIDVPLDYPGCDYLFLCAAVGNARFPDYGIKLPMILNAAGVSYTFSSVITDTGTDIEYVLAHEAISREMLCEIEDEARRLGAKKVLISECGCDVRTFYHETGRILGRPFGFPVQSIDSLMLELVKSGRLPVKKIPGAVTFHDPCKVSRLSGMSELSRELLAQVAENPVEMVPNREYNYCCNGGTGPLRLAENNATRRRVSRFKAEQIRQTGAERVVSPCAVCMLTLEDIAVEYSLVKAGARMSYMLFELVYEALEFYLVMHGSLSRVKKPAVFNSGGPAAAEQYSFSYRTRRLLSGPGYPALYEWLKSDPVVKRYAAANPAAYGVLESWAPGIQG